VDWVARMTWPLSPGRSAGKILELRAAHPPDPSLSVGMTSTPIPCLLIFRRAAQRCRRLGMTSHYVTGLAFFGTIDAFAIGDVTTIEWPLCTVRVGFMLRRASLSSCVC
jgi:hypothetical protein